MTKTAKADLYERVTNQIIDALEGGTVPWARPWDPRIGAPLSMSTRKPYRGINPFLLSIASQAGGYTSPFWGTYKKITELGGQVRKGERSTMVTFWKTGKREVTDAVTGDTSEKRWAVLRSYLVFNAEQADGLPDRFYEVPEGIAHDPIEAAQSILDGYIDRDGSPRLSHVVGQGAYYVPVIDQIVLPPLPAFLTAEGYYSTAFHEATHSTGHRTRLKREGVTEAHRFGDPVYSQEELVAEMGAAMLAGVAGIEQATIEQSAAYLASWIGVLKGDAKLAIAAAGQAQRACDLILGTTFDNDDKED